MDNLTPQEIKEIRNNLIERFNLADGGYLDKIDAISLFENRLCRDDLICVMNPNFDEIYRYFKDNREFKKYLNIYGRCIYNKFNEGIPEDPINLEPIDVDRVVIIRGYGYDKGTSGRLVKRGMKNPITNKLLSLDEAIQIERESTLTGNEFLNAMYGDDEN